MSISSALRGAHYLARDIWPALQRLVTPIDDDSPDAFAEHLARVRAEALAEREAQTEVTEPLGDCGLGEADECLCDEDGVSCDSCRDVPPGASPLTNVITTGRPSTWFVHQSPDLATCLASMDARLTAIHDHLTSAAPGANLPPDAAPESPAPPVPEAGAGHPDISDDDWTLTYIAIEHMARVSRNAVPWKALAERISHARARSK